MEIRCSLNVHCNRLQFVEFIYEMRANPDSLFMHRSNVSHCRLAMLIEATRGKLKETYVRIETSHRINRMQTLELMNGRRISIYARQTNSD